MLFSNIIGELTGSVGNGLANQSSDIKKVKDGLSNLGLFKDNEIEDQDFITRDLDEGIKSFQRDKDIKVDGRLFPKGETERELFSDNLVSMQPKKPKQKPQANPLLNLVEQIIKPKSVEQSDVIADLKDKQSLTSEDVPIPTKKPTVFDGTHMPVDATGRAVLGDAFISSKFFGKQEKVNDLDQRLEEFDFNSNGETILDKVKKSPIDSLLVQKIARETKGQTENEFPNIQNQGDNQADAFRHVLWNVKLTRKMGPAKAKEFTDAYERNKPKQSKGSLLMDLENNRIGRRLAVDPKNKDKSDVEIVREALKNRMLVISPPNITEDKLPFHIPTHLR